MMLHNCCHNTLMVNPMAKTFSKVPKLDFPAILIQLIWRNRDIKQVKDKLLELFKYVVSGLRVKKKHFEMIFSYLNTSSIQDREHGEEVVDDLECYHLRLGVIEEMLTTILQTDILASSMIGPCNYFYFSGLGSGINLSRNFMKNPFSKAFIYCTWFRIEYPCSEEAQSAGYPVLFSFQMESGGFEAYMIGTKLFY